MRGRIVLVAIGALLAAAVFAMLASFGFPLAFAVAWLVIAVTVIVAGRQAFVDEGDTWPPEAPPRDVRGSEVSRLAWAINSRTGVVGFAMVRRVQGTLRRRLAHHDLDLDDAADHARIDALLGEGVRVGLHSKEVRSSDIERVLDAVDRIPIDPKENR